ncbi:MAG: hypothetical protein U9R27_07445 [Campylobacterota bacterium]|nr:hypothetical protein [Campylobacterota bacterium]
MPKIEPFEKDPKLYDTEIVAINKLLPPIREKRKRRLPFLYE